MRSRTPGLVRRLWRGSGGLSGLRRRFLPLRPLPGFTRHLVQALGDVPRLQRDQVIRARAQGDVCLGRGGG